MIVGDADLPGSLTHDAFLWTKKTGMIDLGTQDGDPCSHAISINSSGQVVGGSTDCSNFLHAFLWEKGGPMIDLNNFAPSGVTLTEATYISDNGWISVQAVLSNGDNHAAVLIPCDDNRNGCQHDVRAGALSDHPAAPGGPDGNKLRRAFSHRN